jgi:hypothetical protein
MDARWVEMGGDLDGLAQVICHLWKAINKCCAGCGSYPDGATAPYLVCHCKFGDSIFAYSFFAFRYADCQRNFPDLERCSQREQRYLEIIFGERSGYINGRTL